VVLVTGLEDFKEEEGVDVQIVVYGSQEEALDSIRDGEVYDLVVLDNNNVAIAVQDGLLAEINHTNVLNFQHTLPGFRDPTFDPKNKHSIPFTWGTTAPLVRSDLKNEIISWGSLWELPATKGKIAFRDEPREVLGASLISLGYSMNSEDPDELEAAVDHLLEIKDKIIIVDTYPDTVTSMIKSGEVAALAVAWVDDALYARNHDIFAAYIYPEDGPILWSDSFVIPASSLNKYTSEIFLNFLMRPEIAARVTNEKGYATTNQGASKFIDPDIRNDPVIFPPRNILKSAQITLAHSPAGRKAFDLAWSRFMKEMGANPND